MQLRQVAISCIRRGGKLDIGAIICKPNAKDLLQYQQLKKKFRGGVEVTDDNANEKETCRVVIGHVTSGSVSHVRSPKGIGIGIMQEQEQPLLAFYMVKNPTSPFYRPIDLQIL